MRSGSCAGRCRRRAGGAGRRRPGTWVEPSDAVATNSWRITSRTSSSLMPKLIACAPPCRWMSSTTSSGVVPLRPAIATRSSPAHSGRGAYRAIRIEAPPSRSSSARWISRRSAGAALRVGGQPGEIVGVPLDRPVRHDHRGQLGARGDVRILVGRDDLARRARLRRSAPGPGRPSPSTPCRWPSGARCAPGCPLPCRSRWPRRSIRAAWLPSLRMCEA